MYRGEGWHRTCCCMQKGSRGVFSQKTRKAEQVKKMGLTVQPYKHVSISVTEHVYFNYNKTRRKQTTFSCCFTSLFSCYTTYTVNSPLPDTLRKRSSGQLYLRTPFQIPLLPLSQNLYLHIPVSGHSLVSGRGHF